MSPVDRLRTRRMAKEIDILSSSPPPGIAAWPHDKHGDGGEHLNELEAEIIGAADTPYAGGVFRLRVSIPVEYPLRPPAVRFLTKIYHPNIDTQGRICLDTLNMPPKGAWKPSLNIATVLASVQLLMSHPNADDGLMADITDEFKRFPARFAAIAMDWTSRYAHADTVRANTRGASTENGQPTGPSHESSILPYDIETLNKATSNPINPRQLENPHSIASSLKKETVTSSRLNSLDDHATSQLQLAAGIQASHQKEAIGDDVGAPHTSTFKINELTRSSHRSSPRGDAHSDDIKVAVSSKENSRSSPRNKGRYSMSEPSKEDVADAASEHKGSLAWHPSRSNSVSPLRSAERAPSSTATQRATRTRQIVDVIDLNSDDSSEPTMTVNSRLKRRRR